MGDVRVEISRKEYLKRYLDGDCNEKKNKKKIKKKLSEKKYSGLKIVDADNDLRSIEIEIKDDDEIGDEAPIVAEVIDERPKEVKIRELYQSSRWKKLGDNASDSQEKDEKHSSLDNPAHQNMSRLTKSLNQANSDSDYSPHEYRNETTSQKAAKISSNYSSKNVANQRGDYEYDSDLSPSREKKMSRTKYSFQDVESSSKNLTTSSRMSHNSDSDLSPERVSNSAHRGGNSSRNRELQVSQVISRKTRFEPQFREESHTKHRHDSDSDFSPPRKNYEFITAQDSPSNKEAPKHKNDSHRALKDKAQSSSRFSEEFHNNKGASKKSQHVEKNYEKNKDNQFLPSNQSEGGKKSRPSSTLLGLAAGLQDASKLREETKDLRKREQKLIMEMSDELSGRTSETVLRDRSTGGKRNLKEERRKQKVEDQKLAERQEKYAEWGTGVQQKEDQTKRFEVDSYEMTKPLARYRDDQDLEDVLKEKERDGDPMLEYMRKKKQKTQTNVPSSTPKYNGPPAPPNRFSIQPGYRWDGVDRSNGFEKRYFEKINATKAKESESYLWSVQDM